MWVYRSAKPDKKVILFDYRETQQARWPKEILSGFKLMDITGITD